MRNLRIGLGRGWTEYVHLLKDRKEWATGMIGSVGIFAVLLLWMGDTQVKGTDMTVATTLTAGFLAFGIFGAGLMTLPLTLSADREEGTLLRLRALPGGIPAYLVGRAVTLLCQIAVNSVLVLATGVIVGGVALPHDWLTLVWVVMLGTVSVVPLGAAIGCLIPGPKTAGGVLALVMMPLMLISGVMLPMTFMPEAVRAIAQVFPLYWQGLGLRAAMLPDSMLAVEIGHGWRLPQAAAVLAAWSVAGMLVAPRLVARVTRRTPASRSPARPATRGS
ncbi:ABC transporter permease [Sphaerisporangium fuscum]|uniref:ABC transporter permease n=1 Tax=Sphaerisporangium fuscum TaxID=2835868 RepID=UPI0020299E53|nr:ABC transporter permease [Sphaerisporangium fuscum]